MAGRLQVGSALGLSGICALLCILTFAGCSSGGGEAGAGAVVAPGKSAPRTPGAYYRADR